MQHENVSTHFSPFLMKQGGFSCHLGASPYWQHHLYFNWEVPTLGTCRQSWGLNAPCLLHPAGTRLKQMCNGCSRVLVRGKAAVQHSEESSDSSDGVLGAHPRACAATWVPRAQQMLSRFKCGLFFSIRSLGCLMSSPLLSHTRDSRTCKFGVCVRSVWTRPLPETPVTQQRDKRSAEVQSSRLSWKGARLKPDTPRYLGESKARVSSHGENARIT